MKNILFVLVFLTCIGCATVPQAQEMEAALSDTATVAAATEGYTFGPGDILGLDLIQPEKISTRATVSPDGTITVPYIGQVQASGQTANQVREAIEQRLGQGYLKYPAVMVSLLESHSRRFFVYGAVIRPGEYSMAEKMTVLRAISMAGGFTKFGSSSRVKVLRANKDSTGGYESIKINIKAVMAGDSQADLPIEHGDIIVISEGLF